MKLAATCSFDGSGGPLPQVNDCHHCVWLQVNDDPARHDYNVDEWVDKVVQNAKEQDNHTLSLHQLWACGTDFQYQNAVHWYRNLDKLIHYVNLNGTINMFYSTPSLYTDEKKKWSGSYESGDRTSFLSFDCSLITVRLPSVCHLIADMSGARTTSSLLATTLTTIGRATSRADPRSSGRCAWVNLIACDDAVMAVPMAVF